MKIIFIDPQSYHNLADYDKYLLENIKGEKIFFCSFKLPYKNILNTSIVYNYHYNEYKLFIKLYSYLLSQFKLLIKIFFINPDIIHFQWFKLPFIDYILLRILKINNKTRIVYTAHNLLPHNSNMKYYCIFKKIYNIVDRIIVHTEISKEEIIKIFEINPNKLELIRHGLLPIKNKSKKIFNYDCVTFSFIGRLSEYKGLDILIKAWINNDKIINNDKCRLIIAGAGDLECLKNIPKNKNIIIRNYFHTDEELDEIFTKTDVGILPYRKISQSGVYLKYLSQCIPVIVSNIGGLKQPFLIGNIGWIIKDINESKLSKLISYIISNPDVIRKIKNNEVLWSKLHEYYSWENIGTKTFELYENMLYT